MKSPAKPEPKARAVMGPPEQTSEEPSGPELAPARAPEASASESAGAGEPASEGKPPKIRRDGESRGKKRSGLEPNNVRKLRQEAMMSKAELARRAGVSPLTID